MTVQADQRELLAYLKKDFSLFLLNEKPNDLGFHLQIFIEKPPVKKIPTMVSSMQTLNSICYDHEGIRYCDYYGELLVIFDQKSNKAEVYSENREKIHEVIYLLILSRIGKQMDLQGLHKLHAFSVSYKDLAIVCMMPMKGGKSTLLLEFLKDKRFKIISDDIPLVNLKGEILPFPIKIGLSDHPIMFDVKNPQENFYTMTRSQYGTKKLLSLAGIPERVEALDKNFKKVLLIEAFRYNDGQSILKNSSFKLSLKGVLKHGIIGFGLPMVMEYFWQNGWRDFLIKTRIFLSRCIAFGALLIRAKKVKLFLGTRPEKAAEEIIQYAIKNYDEI